MEKIDAIVLAGGWGTRLRSVVNNVPKVLAPVNGKPFLDLLLNFLSNSGLINKVILAVGYMSDKIIERYETGRDYSFKIIFSEEKELLGTGGGIKRALGYSDVDDVLALNGDSYISVDLTDLFMSHNKNNAAMTIVLKEVENANRYGSVKIDKSKRIISFEEKKQDAAGGFINAGMYLFKRKLFDAVDSNKVLSLEKDLLPGFIKGAVYGYISYGKFIDIGIPETYKNANQYLKGI